MTQTQTEAVLVVPTELFHRLGHFQGFCGDVARYLPELFSPEHTSYRPRHEVEEDPGYKQLIPYVVFCYRDSAGDVSVFGYTRGKGQGEGRLHSKLSVGVGGHISTDDISNGEGDTDAAAYAVGMRRELAEEVIIDTPFTQRCVGLINDDETEVGKVHLGVVHVFDVEAPTVRPREADLVEARFRPVAEIMSEIDRCETWSQICLRALFGDSR